MSVLRTTYPGSFTQRPLTVTRPSCTCTKACVREHRPSFERVRIRFLVEGFDLNFLGGFGIRPILARISHDAMRNSLVDYRKFIISDKRMTGTNGASLTVILSEAKDLSLRDSSAFGLRMTNSRLKEVPLMTCTLLSLTRPCELRSGL